MLVPYENIADPVRDGVEQPSVLVLESTQSRLNLAPILLKPGKWTIGSAVGCSPRLKVAGVQPRHCLVIVCAERTLLKSWSRRTWLNERAIREAILKPGDHLTVGPLEFLVRRPNSDELLEHVPDVKSAARPIEPTTAEAPSPYRPERVPAPVAPQPPVDLNERYDRLTVAERAVAHAQQDLARQYAELESDRAILEAARCGLEDERQRCARDRAELLRLRRELDRRCEELERRESALLQADGDGWEPEKAHVTEGVSPSAAQPVESLVSTSNAETFGPFVPTIDHPSHVEPSSNRLPDEWDSIDSSANAPDSDVGLDEGDGSSGDEAAESAGPTPGDSTRPATAEDGLKRMRWVQSVKCTIAAVALSIATVLFFAEIWSSASYSRTGWAAAIIGVIAAVEATRTTLTLHRLNRAKPFRSPFGQSRRK